MPAQAGSEADHHQARTRTARSASGAGKSKEIAAKSIKSLDALAGVGDADVARIADSIRGRLDRASAESEMLSASLDRQMDDLLDRDQLDAQLSARKARLGLAKEAGS